MKSLKVDSFHVQSQRPPHVISVVSVMRSTVIIHANVTTKLASKTSQYGSYTVTSTHKERKTLGEIYLKTRKRQISRDLVRNVVSEYNTVHLQRR